MEKQWKIGNRGEIIFIEKDDVDKLVKTQSKLNFVRTHKPSAKYKTYKYKHNEILIFQHIFSKKNSLCWNYQNYKCMKHIMTISKTSWTGKYKNCIIWILTLL